MVVGHFLVVDDLGGITGNRRMPLCETASPRQPAAPAPVDSSCHIRGQIAAVSTGIGAELLFIQALQIVQGLLGGEPKQPVGIPLEGGQVIEGRRLFGFFLAPHLFHRGSCTLAGRFQLLGSSFICHALPGNGETGQLQCRPYKMAPA